MMWVIVVLVVAVVFFLILKYQDFHGHVSNFIVLAAMLSIVLSFGYVYLSKSPDFSTLDGVVVFLKTYLSWVGATFGNAGKIVGYAVDQNWTPALNLSAVPAP